MGAPGWPLRAARVATAAALVAMAVAALAGCAAPRMPEAAAIARPALVSLFDSQGSADGVQLIVHAIDGRRPAGAGRAKSSSGSALAGEDDTPGTIIAQPPLRPGRWDFAVEPGSRRLDLIFAVPGSAWLNLAAVTRGRGSEATGIEIETVAGCQYLLAAKLTVASGRDYAPEVRLVRPIPATYGLPRSETCPQAREVAVRIVRGG